MNFKGKIFTADITVFQLRAARRGLNLTVSDVANQLSITPGSVVRSEAGDIFEVPKRTGTI